VRGWLADGDLTCVTRRRRSPTRLTPWWQAARTEISVLFSVGGAGSRFAFHAERATSPTVA